MNNNNILISIIIPCYNCEEYLHSSLDSVLNQNCKDIELIFIDDGSTDNSLKKAENILGRSGIKHKIIKQKNQGVSVARNIGIENAVGEYIYFLDSDDYISNTFFQLVKGVINVNSPDSIIFGYNRSSNGNINWKYEDEFNYLKNEKKGNEICKLFLNQKIAIHLCSLIVKRKILIDNNIKFRVNCYYGEDVEFVIKELYFCEKVLTIPKSLFIYCSRNDSAMQTFSEKRFTGMDAIVGLKQYFIDVIHCEDIELIRLLDVRITKEVIYIYQSELFFHRDNENNKDIYKKMNTLINEYKYMLKNFVPVSKEDKSLKKVAKYMVVNHKLYALFRKKSLKIKRIIKKVCL